MNNEWHLHTMEYRDGNYHYNLVASYSSLDDAMAHQSMFSAQGVDSNVSSEAIIKPNKIFNTGFAGAIK